MRLGRTAVFTVSTSDDRGPGSLREAITQANQLGTAARIEFAIGRGAATIQLASPLPPITFSGALDGWTQPGFAGSPLVEIDGANAKSGRALTVHSSDVVVRGLAITRWPDGGVFVKRCDDVVLCGLYIGVRTDGVTAAGNGGVGLRIRSAKRCTVGGAGQSAVVVAGNEGHGILVRRGSHDFRLEGALIGTDRSGAVRIPNQGSGVKVTDSSDVVIGRAGGPPNVIAGNHGYGIEIKGTASAGAVLAGNHIGICSSGCSPLPNDHSGVVVYKAPSVRIEGNVISGNLRYGIEIAAPESTDAVVAGNRIGTDLAGLAAVPNHRSGVLVYNAGGVCLGGPSAGAANIISGNARAGINLDGSVLPDRRGPGDDYTGVGHARENLVQGNLVGVDATGEAPLGNQLRGILVNHAQDNTIVDNVVSGNGQDGILILGPEDASDPRVVPSGNVVLRNLIGVTAHGAPCGNGRDGVLVMYGKHNRIGDPNEPQGNVVAHNQARGITFYGRDARTNTLGPFERIAANGGAAFYQPPETEQG